jgi:hypothetical protein
MVALNQDPGRPVLLTQSLHAQQDLGEYPRDVQAQLGIGRDRMASFCTMFDFRWG